MDEGSSTYGSEERCMEGVVGKSEGKRSLVIPKLR
jgi:hypothetical protein